MIHICLLSQKTLVGPAQFRKVMCCCCCVLMIVIIAVAGPFITIIKDVAKALPTWLQGIIFFIMALVVVWIGMMICCPNVTNCIMNVLCCRKKKTEDEAEKKPLLKKNPHTD